MSRQFPPTVVLCFDGLSFQYLDAFDLPHFSSLRSRGIEAPLRSTFPPWTGSAWPSMYTGTDPDHHGVYDFFSFGKQYPDDADLVTRNDVRAPAIWNYLSTREIPSIALNVPITYPAEPIEGVIVPGYLAPEAAAGYPADIRNELAEELGEYRIYSRAELGFLDDDSVDDFVDLIDLRRRAARHLLASKEWRLAVLQVQKTDAVFHNFDDDEAFARVYRAADEFLGTVLDAVDQETNVVVCSDHGIGPTEGYRIYLNRILREEGFVEPTDRSDTVPQLRREKRRLTGGGTDGETGIGADAGTNADAGMDTGDGARAAAGDDTNTDDGDGTGLTPQAVSLAHAVMQRLGVSVDEASAIADRLGVLPLVTRHFSDAIRESFERGVDWRASTAFCRSGNELGVRINRAGREADGVVTDDEYEAVRDELIDVLSALETPDGDPAFEFVKRREEVYQGPHADDACDVLFLPHDMQHTVATNLMGADFVPIDDHDHKRDGTFIGAGPGFDAGTDVEALSLTDVAPIALSLLGCPVPERMTGSVPGSLLSVPVTTDEYHDVQFATGSADRGVDGRVEGHLEDLGYLQ